MLFNNVIPYPREVVVICLLKTCDVMRFIFQLDDEVEARIEAISNIDLIGRAITNAVTQNLAGPACLGAPALPGKSRSSP